MERSYSMKDSNSSNSSRVRGEKRGLDPISDNNQQDGQPIRKRPALASVIVEALKLDSLQKLCSSLEPILRRVVSEEVERALAKLAPTKLNERNSPKRIEAKDERNLQLHFRSKLSLPLFTGGKVEGENGASLHIILLDSDTGRVITSGPESSAKLDIVVLEGDFNNEDDENWTQEEFESHIVKEREGKRPLLTGDLQVTLKEGVGTLGELSFTDNSSWIRSRKFRLGLKVSSPCFQGFRIREAKTDAFIVKDHRGELYKKHYPPALNDEVWRLEKIGKDGSFHKRLNKAGIFSVEDFLRLVVRDPQRLRKILGSGMSNKMWDALVEHAKTCVLSGKLYVYYPDDIKNVGVVFNNVYELSGLIANEQYFSADSLSDSQKVFVDSLVKKAYDNWMNVVEYDGKSLISFTQSKNSYAIGSQNHLNSFENQLNVTSNQPLMASGITIGGYDDNLNNRYSIPSLNMNLNDTIHLDSSLLPSHNELIKSDDILTLGPIQSSFETGGASNVNSYRGYEEYFNEEEIRVRSNEMLENEDMQHLLRIFNMSSHGQCHGQGHGLDISNNNYYPFSPDYMGNISSNFVLNEEQTRSSGKAVVGWLKLKAALRWGIFIRKKAAERRAQIVELDDS